MKILSTLAFASAIAILAPAVQAQPAHARNGAVASTQDYLALSGPDARAQRSDTQPVRHDAGYGSICGLDLAAACTN